MDAEWVTVVDARWPWLILIAVAAIGTPYAIKSLKTLKTFAWDPFVAYMRGVDSSRKAREEINAKIADLEQQVTFLIEQVTELRHRDRMYWAWTLEDQSWHRNVELLAIERGWKLPVHISFDDFYDEWTKAHPSAKPFPP